MSNITPIKVSVVIPVYNVENFLEETIQSVLEQSLGEIEVILVNDGSPDNCANICKAFAEKNRRVTFIDQTNQGVSVARNNGLKHATGEFVFFMDSDDTLDRDFIRTSYNAAKQNEADMVIIGSYYLKRLPNVHSLPTCAQFWRRSFLLRYPDIRFPEGLQPCEDGLFSHQLLALTTQLATNEKGIYHYRQHANQNHIKVNENVEKVIQQVPVWLAILEKFYRKYDLFQTKILHLALFIEHEPFEIRYRDMPLNSEQEKFLHSHIKGFAEKYLVPNLKQADWKLLSKPFRFFIQAESPADFERLCKNYLIRRKTQRKILMLLTKLVFINSIKQKFRRKIRDKFDR